MNATITVGTDEEKGLQSEEKQTCRQGSVISAHTFKYEIKLSARDK